MEQGLGSSTWWEEVEYKQLETANLGGPRGLTASVVRSCGPS